jgi:hypothetical protein
MADIKDLLNSHTCQGLSTAQAGNSYHKRRVATDYNELVGAINELEDGGIIELMPGDYEGDITIGTDLTIKGQGLGITRLLGSITVNTAETYNTVQLQEFKIEAPDDTVAITATQVGELILKDMEIKGSIASLEIVDINSGVLITNNIVVYNANSTSPASIALTGSDGVAVKPNILVNSFLIGDIDYADIHTLISGISLTGSASNATNTKAPAGTDSTGYYASF